jgi:hypothetical protein
MVGAAAPPAIAAGAPAVTGLVLDNRTVQDAGAIEAVRLAFGSHIPTTSGPCTSPPASSAPATIRRPAS